VKTALNDATHGLPPEVPFWAATVVGPVVVAQLPFATTLVTAIAYTLGLLVASRLAPTVLRDAESDKKAALGAILAMSVTAVILDLSWSDLPTTFAGKLAIFTGVGVAAMRLLRPTPVTETHD
jgi:hypothetical protein